MSVTEQVGLTLIIVMSLKLSPYGTWALMELLTTPFKMVLK